MVFFGSVMEVAVHRYGGLLPTSLYLQKNKKPKQRNKHRKLLWPASTVSPDNYQTWGGGGNFIRNGGSANATYTSDSIFLTLWWELCWVDRYQHATDNITPMSHFLVFLMIVTVYTKWGACFKSTSSIFECSKKKNFYNYKYACEILTMYIYPIWHTIRWETGHMTILLEPKTQSSQDQFNLYPNRMGT